MLHLTGGALLGILLAGCGSEGSGGGESTAEHSSADARGIVFNTGSKDVTLFDPAANEVTGTRQTSAAVRWLSNEQHYWDGESIWTYDFPNNELQAIAIDPQTFEVIKQVPVGGSGPGHSFVLSPDTRRGFVNSAGSDFLAVVDPAAGEVIERVEMGAFP
jgi:DNA-binding beta-propeller fold protein YncE